MRTGEGLRAGQGKAETGLKGISSREIPDRTGTGAKAGMFNRLYDLKYKSSILLFLITLFPGAVPTVGIDPSRGHEPSSS